MLPTLANASAPGAACSTYLPPAAAWAKNNGSEAAGALAHWALYQRCFAAEREDEAAPPPAACLNASLHGARFGFFRQTPNVLALCYQCACHVAHPAVGTYERLAGLGAGGYCREWHSFVGFNSMMSLAVTGVVVLMNQCIKLAIERLVRHEKPHTIGAEQKSLGPPSIPRTPRSACCWRALLSAM